MAEAIDIKREKNRKRVEKKIARKENLDELVGKTGLTELHKAVLDSDISLIQLLLGAGASANVKEAKSGWTPLMIATLQDNCEVMELLINHNANVNEVEESHNHTALHIAAECKGSSTDRVGILLNNGGDLHVLDKEGYCPAFRALTTDNLEILKIMIGHGACVDRCIKFIADWNSLLMDDVKKYAEFMDILLSAGGDINIRSKGLNWTHLMLTIVGNKHNKKGLLIYLLKKNADISAKNINAGREPRSAVDMALGGFACGIPALNKEKDRTFFKLCFAAGGVPLPKNHGKETRKLLEEYFPDFLKIITHPCLANLCRKAIRSHLIQVNPPGNLFTYVPLLKLPSPITSYLLYDMSLEDYDEEISEEYRKRRGHGPDIFRRYKDGPPVGREVKKGRRRQRDGP